MLILVVIFTPLLYIKTMDKKTVLRANAKNIRKNLPLDEISVNLAAKIKRDDNYIAAKNVMLFYPTKFEVNLLSLLEDNKNFYLPKVSGNELLVCPYCKEDKLEKSLFNILEPCSAPVNPGVLDLIIVPALAVDKRGYRLGYGGGFYDRFLVLDCVRAKSICAIPKSLLIDEIPIENYDVPMDIIITV